MAHHLYIAPCSSNILVRGTIAHQHRSAAADELLKQSAVIDVEGLYSEADNAFGALSTLLGEDDYFFDAHLPGLFDASVFAYTHLLLNEGVRWKEKRMATALAKYKNLVHHQDRILHKYYGRKGKE